jgi:DtxR family Mn-dependent transcriptional regulator
MKKNTGKRSEDYLETIFLLSKEKRVIRIKDIAERLKVKKSTVVSMVDKLVKEHYLVHERYGDVFLNQKGIKKAEEIYKKHITIFSFLKDILNISESIAEKDACNLEHHISDETVDKLLKFIEFFYYKAGSDKQLIEDLKNYFLNGEFLMLSECYTLNIKKMKSLKTGQKGKILSLKNSNTVRNNLFSDGIRPGEIIEIIKKDTNNNIIRFMINDSEKEIGFTDAENIDVVLSL